MMANEKDSLRGRKAVEYAISDLISGGKGDAASEIFYGQLAVHCKKYIVNKETKGRYAGVPTAAVAIDGNRVALIVNEDFFASIPHEERIEVIKHEMQHVAHRHLTRGGKDSGYNPRIANIAMDAVINQYNRLNDLRPDTYVDYRKIEGAVPHDAFENYYRLLLADDEEPTCPTCGGTGESSEDSNGGSGSGSEGSSDAGNEPGKGKGSGKDENATEGDSGASGAGSGDTGSGEGNSAESSSGGTCPDCGGTGSKYGKVMDSHKFFGEADEDSNIDFVEEAIKDMVSKAAKTVEKRCGNLPAEIAGIVAEILGPPKVNWRKVLRNWMTEAYRREKTYSSLREHKVLSDVYPGISFRRLPKFTVYVDVSGSVSEEEFNAFMTEIVGINKSLKAEVLVAQFDTVVHRVDRVVKPSDIPTIERAAAGGTSFEDILRHARETKTRNIIIMTDGFAPPVDTTGFNVLWAFTPNHDASDKKGKKIVIDDI